MTESMMSESINVVLKQLLENNLDLTGEDDREYVPSPQDEYIRQATKYKNVKIRIIGCGGAGSNTISRLFGRQLDGADLLAMNTDANHLRTIISQAKLLIGKRRTKGMGSGGLPQIGEEAAMEDISQIRELLKGTDIAFVTCGLGGGTGTGSAPVVAKVAKEAGATVISIVTLPFTSEGKIRMENAMVGLDRLYQFSNTLIAVPNDKLLSESPSKSMQEAFRYSDSVLTETMQGLTEIIRRTGLINIDYADVKNVMKAGGVAVVGMGESTDEPYARISNAIDRALSFPLIEADVSEAKGCVIRVIGGKDMTLKESEQAAAAISKKIDKNAKIIWGASIDPRMEKKVRVLILLTGIKSPYSVSSRADVENLGKKLGVFNRDVGIDVVN